MFSLPSPAAVVPNPRRPHQHGQSVNTTSRYFAVNRSSLRRRTSAKVGLCQCCAQIISFYPDIDDISVPVIQIYVAVHRYLPHTARFRLWYRPHCNYIYVPCTNASRLPPSRLSSVQLGIIVIERLKLSFSGLATVALTSCRRRCSRRDTNSQSFRTTACYTRTLNVPGVSPFLTFYFLLCVQIISNKF